VAGRMYPLLTAASTFPVRPLLNVVALK